MRGPVAWWNDPWRPPRFLIAVTAGYLAWSLLPVLIAVAYSFNDGRSRTSWQGFSFRWYWGDKTLSVWHNEALHTLRMGNLPADGGAVYSARDVLRITVLGGDPPYTPHRKGDTMRFTLLP